MLYNVHCHLSQFCRSVEFFERHNEGLIYNLLFVLCADGSVSAGSDGTDGSGALDNVASGNRVLVQVNVLTEDLKLFHATL